MLHLINLVNYILGLNGHHKLLYKISQHILDKVSNNISKNITLEDLVLLYNKISSDIFKQWTLEQQINGNDNLLFMHPNLIHYLINDQIKMVSRDNQNYLQYKKSKLYISCKTRMAYEFTRELNQYFYTDGYTELKFIVENDTPHSNFQSSRVTCMIPAITPTGI